jgi:hypothetical protein
VSAQLDFLARGAARIDDPVTAKEAGARANDHRASQEAAILGALRDIGLPATASQIAAQLGAGWDNVRVSRRLAAMRDAGSLYSFDGKAGRPLLRRAGQCLHQVAVGYAVQGAA